MEPAKGFMKGSLDGFEGIAKGGMSLLTHTAGGITNSIYKIADGVTTATSILSMDQEYINKREQAKKNIPKKIG